MIYLLNFLLFIITLPALLACSYLFVLSVLSGRSARRYADQRENYFFFVVPAHNEEKGLQRTLESLKRACWRPDLFTIVVVADNCSDSTAAIARDLGATVLERKDNQRRGKGYALDYAFNWCRRQNHEAAIVVVDADTVIDAGLLAAFNRGLNAGEPVMQGHYGILNAYDSWRTRLMAIAFTCFHQVRSRGRERLHLSCGIRGNGWCFAPDVLSLVPYAAHSLAEDVEFGIELALKARLRVSYIDDAVVLGEATTKANDSAGQQKRWASGRLALLKSHGLLLARAAIRERDFLMLDLLLDLLVPPLSVLLLWIVTVAALAWMFALVNYDVRFIGIVVGVSLLQLIAYVGRGWFLSGIGVRGLLDLLRVPGFILWKVVRVLASAAPSQWIRTNRIER